MSSVAIVGAGLTGLAAAAQLERAGRAVTVFEAAASAGGFVGTQADGEWRYESGPNTMAAGEDALTLLRELGVGDVLLEASEAAKKRFLVKNGKPVALPMSPPGIVKTPLFSFGAKMALFAEPFKRRRPGELGEESVASFVRRRLNDEWLRRAIGPFVSGVYAGDPEMLSLRFAFPKMFAMEEQYGSLIKAAVKTGKSPGRGLYSTPSGLGGLVDALARKVTDLRLGTRVESLRRDGGDWVLAAGGAEQRFTDLILTVGPAAAASLIDGVAAGAAGELRKLRQPPLVVVHQGFRRADVAHPLDGFGMLIPREEGFRTLGTLFISSMFPGRTPAGHVLLSSYVGGALAPRIADEPVEKVRDEVVAENAQMLGITAAPAWTKAYLVHPAIVQYDLGYAEIKAALDAAETELRGLLLRGNYVGGVALPDRIAAGVNAARQVAGLAAA